MSSILFSPDYDSYYPVGWGCQRTKTKTENSRSEGHSIPGKNKVIILVLINQMAKEEERSGWVRVPLMFCVLHQLGNFLARGQCLVFIGTGVDRLSGQIIASDWL